MAVWFLQPTLQSSWDFLFFVTPHILSIGKPSNCIQNPSISYQPTESPSSAPASSLTWVTELASSMISLLLSCSPTGYFQPSSTVILLKYKLVQDIPPLKIPTHLEKKPKSQDPPWSGPCCLSASSLPALPTVSFPWNTLASLLCLELDLNSPVNRPCLECYSPKHTLGSTTQLLQAFACFNTSQ